MFGAGVVHRLASGENGNWHLQLGDASPMLVGPHQASSAA